MRVRDRLVQTFWVMGIGVLGLNFVRIPTTLAVEEFTLDVAVQTALTLNPELKAIREKINVTQARLDGIALLGNPEIETEVAGGIPGDQTYELTKSFELAGQRGHRKRMALTNIEKRNAEIAETSRLLTKSVKIAFCDLILIQEKLKLGKEVVQLGEQVVEIAGFQFEAGEISVTQLNLAKIQLQSALRELSALESQLQLAQLELNNLMGTPLEQSLIAVGQLKSKPREFTLDTLTATALAHRARSCGRSGSGYDNRRRDGRSAENPLLGSARPCHTRHAGHRNGVGCGRSWSRQHRISHHPGQEGQRAGGCKEGGLS